MENNIAYLAPEIPALSATFVYQEILELEKIGLIIKPISIHRPENKARSNELESLEKRTFYLYEQSRFKVLISNIYLLISTPIKYLSTMRMAIFDAIHVGVLSHVGRGLLYRFFIAAGLVDFLRKNNIGHIHSNFAHIPTDIAMYAASIHGVTFSFNSHANDLFERGWLLKEKIDRAKFAVTISMFNKLFLIEQGADKNKINVIHCGIDTSKFTDRGIKELSDLPVLGALGRMVEKKGFEVLVKACEILKNEGVRFKLQLAGGGPLKGELENLASCLKLTDSIDFIDSISHQKVPEWIKSLDVFILPCKKDEHGDMDGIPVVLMEAMLSGVPVITTRISGIPELVIDDVTGLLCNSEDAECLARKIQLLLKQNINISKIKQNAIAKVRAEFELKENVQLLANKLIE